MSGILKNGNENIKDQTSWNEETTVRGYGLKGQRIQLLIFYRRIHLEWCGKEMAIRALLADFVEISN